MARSYRNTVPAMKDALIVTALSLVPKHTAARGMGWLARLRLPRWLHRLVVRRYAAWFKVDLSEAEGEIDDFGSLSEFFVRALKPGTRPIDPTPDVLVSPADAKVASVGTIEDGRFVQSPGRFDRIELLLGADLAGPPPIDPTRYEGGTYAILYLSPRDYHRVHSPTLSRLHTLRYLPGRLWPVFPPATRRIEELFGRNERLVFALARPNDLLCLVMVGAFGVGRMTSPHLPFPTNGPRGAEDFMPAPAPTLERGDEIGRFELGSTVILVAEPGVLEWTITPGEAVKVGQAIAHDTQG